MTPQTEYRCVFYADIWWYGKVYTVDAVTGKETTVYLTDPWSDKRDAQHQLLDWWQRNRSKGGK